MPEFTSTVTGIKTGWNNGSLTLTLSVPIEVEIGTIYMGEPLEWTLYVDVPSTFQVSIGDRIPIQINEAT